MIVVVWSLPICYSESAPTFRLDQSPTTTKTFSHNLAPQYSGVQNYNTQHKQTNIQLPIRKATESLRISPKFLTQQQLRIPKSTIERP
jgi:hypothetical protein